MNDSLPDKTSDELDALDVAEPEHKDIPKQEIKSTPVESGKPLSLNFQAYNEDLVICGAKGSGKSYLANTILKSLNNITCFVWDFNHAYGAVMKNAYAWSSQEFFAVGEIWNVVVANFERLKFLYLRSRQRPAERMFCSF